MLACGSRRRVSTRSNAARLLVFVGPLLVGCESTTEVQFENGPERIELSAPDWILPEALRENTDQGPRVAELSCASDECPAFDVVALSCEQEACDPGPITSTTFLGEVVDFDAAVTVQPNDIDRFEVERFEYDVELNTLTIPISKIEIFWGPEGAVEIDPTKGVTLAAELPPLGPRTVRSGRVDVETSRRDALSDYLIGTEARVRFLVRSTIDLAPGQPYPEGSVRLAVTMVGSADVVSE